MDFPCRLRGPWTQRGKERSCFPGADEEQDGQKRAPGDKLCRLALAWISPLVLCSLGEECLLWRPWGGDEGRISGCSLPPPPPPPPRPVRVLVCAHAPPPPSSVPLFRSAFHMFSWSGAIIHVCLRLNYSLKALQIWRFSRFVNNSRLLTAPWTAAVNGLLSLRRRFMISILSSLPWYYCGKLMKNAKPCLNQYTTQSTTFFRNVFYIPVSLYESQHKLSLCISFVQWLEKNFKLFQPCETGLSKVRLLALRGLL